MENQRRNMKRLVWDDKYSVGVKKIDKQHKELFKIINRLIEIVGAVPKKNEVAKIADQVLEQKTAHFATEEKYFHKFNYEGTKDHENEHRKFELKIKELHTAYRDDAMKFSFALIDFLEDWLVNHLMTKDQEYKQCFHDHGLR